MTKRSYPGCAPTRTAVTLTVVAEDPPEVTPVVKSAGGHGGVTTTVRLRDGVRPGSGAGVDVWLADDVAVGVGDVEPGTFACWPQAANTTAVESGSNQSRPFISPLARKI